MAGATGIVDTDLAPSFTIWTRCHTVSDLADAIVADASAGALAGVLAGNALPSGNLTDLALVAANAVAALSALCSLALANQAKLTHPTILVSQAHTTTKIQADFAGIGAILTDTTICLLAKFIDAKPTTATFSILVASCALATHTTEAFGTVHILLTLAFQTQTIFTKLATVALTIVCTPDTAGIFAKLSA